MDSYGPFADSLRYQFTMVPRPANSAYFGIPSKVSSVRQGVLLLGLKRLIQLVVASCVSGVMDKPVPGYDLPPGDLWRHSIAVSIAAEALVKDKKTSIPRTFLRRRFCMISAN